MGKRLTKIATRTGDDGTTGLGDGTRVAKDHPRIRILGDLDELNSAIGVILAEPLPERLAHMLVDVQHDLFDVGGEVCIPGRVAIGEAHVLRVDEWLAELNAELPPLREFILPGGCRAAAAAHMARAICRRAERSLVALTHQEPINDRSREYLNRLSDFFFVFSRTLNRENGVGETYWRSERMRGEAAAKAKPKKR